MSDPNAKTKKTQVLILGGVIAAIFGLVIAGMFLFDPAPRKVKTKPVTVSLTPPGTIDDKEAWRATESAKSTANQSKLDELVAKVKAQDDTNKRLSKELEDMKLGKAPTPLSTTPPPAKAVTAEKAAETLDKPLGFPPKPGQMLNSPNSSPVTGKAGTLNRPINGPGQPQMQARDAVEMITFGRPAAGAASSNGTQAGEPQVLGFPVNERAKKMAAAGEGKTGTSGSGIEFIPAGSFVRVAMLNGVDAPTGGQAQSNPLPMAFQVLDTANLANKYRLDIKDCRFIAAAWGDVSSERTFGRTESLTCIINGDTVEMAVKGTVIGEDGKAGMRGRLVTKQGQLLANALFAGSLSGIGKAFQQSATTQTVGGGGVTQIVDPEQVGAAAIGGGVGSAASMLATYYLKVADKLFPVIETDGGRVVEILVTKGAVYKGGAVKRDQYKGLMRRTGATSRSNDED